MISVRCSVMVPGRSGPIDLDVTGPAGSTMADIRDALLDSAGLPDGTPLHVAGARLHPAAEWGQPPLLHGCLLVAGRPEGPDGGTSDRTATAGSLALHVVGGPDSGRLHRLRPGDHLVGRAASAAVRLRDHGVSRHHAVLHVGPEGLRVTDLGSTNGTRVGGVPVLPEGTMLHPGDRLRVGRSTLVVREPGTAAAVTRLTGTGTVSLHRPPRRPPAEPDVVVVRPPRPAAPPRPRSPWLAALLPLLVAGPLALVARQPIFLCFAVLSPVVLIGTSLADRWGRRREHRDAVRAWEEADRRAETTLLHALRAEVEERRRGAADPAEALVIAETPSTRLWERTAGATDLLRVSLGTARVPSTVRQSGAADQPAPWLDDAPVLVSLPDRGHLGLTGARERVVGAARWLLGQVLVWHGPETVHVTAVTDSSSGGLWRWLRWVPHARSLGPDELEAMVARRTAAADHRGFGAAPTGTRPRWVVLVDATELPPARLAATLRDGPTVGVHVLWLATGSDRLPAECGAVLDTDLTGSGRLSAGADPVLAPITVDGVGPAWSERLARALAPLREAQPPGGSRSLPTSAALLDLSDVDLTDAAAVADVWRRGGRTTRAAVGVGEHGVATIDLGRDGPHALIGGTTGSGKSELLQTLVTSLALGNRPDELSFVLVDYKGGATFAECAQLPHVVGVVTDLDEQLAARALTSLQAELTRRERVLAEAGARDLADYQESAPASHPPLGRLVLVIDEFRVLAQELPDFLTGVVRLAAVGRSLGVHLVLATQRPAGVVSADIQANVNLRIALRVRDRADSEDVLDAPDAAHLPEHVPGRALSRTGPGPLTAFQVARVAAWGTRHAGEQARVRVVEDEDDGAAGAQPVSAAPEEQGAEVLGVITATAWEATRRLGIRVPPSPWLPTLPEQLDLGTLERATLEAGREPSSAERPGSAVLGLLDLPHEQRQPALLWHPVADGHLAVVGGRATGRTTALHTLALGLARAWSPGRLQLHLLDVGGSLRGLAALPHVGTALGHDRPALVARLVSRLAEQVAARLAEHLDEPVAGRLAERPDGDRDPELLAPPDAAGTPGSGRGERPLVLLVDGWEAVMSALEAVDHGRAADDLLALIRDGAAAGLRVVLTGGRDVLLGRVSSLVSERLLLRTGDPTDLLLAGLRADAVPGHQPPGRAVRVSDGAQVQMARPRRGRSAAETLAAAVVRARCHRGAGEPPEVVRLRTLPATVRLDALLGTAVRPAGTAGWAVIGVGGDEAQPIGLDLLADPVITVSGPAGSGRSTALRTIGTALLAVGGAVVSIVPRGGGLLSAAWPTCPADDPDALRRLLRECPTTCVLVDDVELLADGPVEPMLVELARRRGPSALVVAGDSSALLHGFRGVGAAARLARTGLVLRPAAPSDGEVLGVRLQVPDERPPGRGVLVVRGTQQPVQVAM